jgi:hypothetical protein
VLAAVGAFALKLAIAATTHGSTDVLLFEADVAKMERDGMVGLYRDGIATEWCGRSDTRPCPPFNHPPFMAGVLRAWSALEAGSGVPLRFWLRFSAAVADVGSLLVLGSLLRRRLSENRTRVALLWFAVSPIAILVSGFHGNTDPIFLFFVLLAIELVEGSDRPAWLAGALLGMAMNIKIVPVLLIPVVALSLSGARRRIEFAIGTLAAFAIGSLPMVLQAPSLLLSQVFGYRSQSGSWGLSLLALVLQQSSGLSWMAHVYLRHGTIAALSLLLTFSCWPAPRRDTLFVHAGLVMFLFVSVIPGFGVQYLVWLVPWVVGLGSGPTVAYFSSASALLIGYYSTAAGGFPWYLANSLARPAWTLPVVLLGLVCWIVVCAITITYPRRLAAALAERGAGAA